MKEFEVFLKMAIDRKNEHNSVNFIPLGQGDREIIKMLEASGYITNVRYISMQAVGFDLNYAGLHYFND